MDRHGCYQLYWFSSRSLYSSTKLLQSRFKKIVNFCVRPLSHTSLYFFTDDVNLHLSVKKRLFANIYLCSGPKVAFVRRVELVKGLGLFLSFRVRSGGSKSISSSNRSFARWRYFTTKTRMLCQNAFLFKFSFSVGNKETIKKISLTLEATNSILVLVVK